MYLTVQYRPKMNFPNGHRVKPQNRQSAHEAEVSGPATAPAGASKDSEGITPLGIILSMGAFVLYIKTAIALNLPVCHQSRWTHIAGEGRLASYCPTRLLLLPQTE